MASTQEQKKGEVRPGTPNSSRRSSTSMQEQAPSLNMSPTQPRKEDSPPPDAPIISPIVTVGLQNDPNIRQGLRRKQTDSPRRSFQSDYERAEICRYSSRRRLRQDDEREREYCGHPDGRERSRPPRSHRNNVSGLDGYGGPLESPNFNDNRTDLERGQDIWSQNFDYDSPRNENFEDNNYERKQRVKFPGQPAGGGVNKSQPWASILDSSYKNHFVSALGEFVGTTMFLFFAFAGAQVPNIGARQEAEDPSYSGKPRFDIAVYLYISFIFGFSLLVNVWIFYRISGAQFNPAVTFALFLVGAVPIVRAIVNIIAQLAGAIAASALVKGLFPLPLSVRSSLGSGTSRVQGVFIEAFLTAELVFTILMLAKEKHRGKFLAPLGIGFALFIAHLVGINFTGSSLNPARSFGPCVVTGTFEDEHWIYWVGPFLGALIAVAFYKLIVLLEYEMVNPGQDGDDKNDPTKNERRYQEIIGRRNRKFI